MSYILPPTSSFRNPCRTYLVFSERYLAATAEVMQKHYPERQSRILVVNAPWWFAGIWKTVSGMLSSGTQAKLQIRGTNFLSTLLEHVDSSQVIDKVVRWRMDLICR